MHKFAKFCKKIWSIQIFVVILHAFLWKGQKKILHLIKLGFHKRERRTALTFNKRISMYAIVEMKGQQFRVEAGKKLFINRIADLEKGATVEFENVLLLDNEGKVKVGAPYVKGAKVVCEVLDNECRGEKILVFHKKRRKGYRKLNGHRQDLTNVVVKEIVIA